MMLYEKRAHSGTQSLHFHLVSPILNPFLRDTTPHNLFSWLERNASKSSMDLDGFIDF